MGVIIELLPVRPAQAWFQGALRLPGINGPGKIVLKSLKGSGSGCAGANLEEIIPEDVIDTQQFHSNIEYRIEYEDETNVFFSKNWIDCQEIIEENNKEADILLIDQGNASFIMQPDRVDNI